MPRLIVMLFACLLPGLASHAQESADEESTGTEREQEIEELEPAVPSTVLAADTERRYTDSGVMDELELGRSEITGNQELPKVLYIVPWRKSDPGDLMGLPGNTLLNEVLAPLDRSEFVRQVDYYHRLNDDNRN